MRIGKLTVTTLSDGSGTFHPWAEMFPAATAAQWEQARAADPAVFGADGRWALAFRCFAIRGAGLTLVDLGVGHAASPARTWAPVPGPLPEELAAAGIDPSDVNTVVLTHLHSDHCGWAITPDGEPMFPNARYVLQRAETSWISDPVLSFAVEPLRAAGVLDEITGEVTVASAPTGEAVTVVPTPGHTPGHQSVLVSDGQTRLAITGDVLVHPVQLIAPDVGYVNEVDQELARITRRTMLESAAKVGALLATPHLTEPFVPAPGATE